MLAGALEPLPGSHLPPSKSLAAAASEGLLLRMCPFMALDLKRVSIEQRGPRKEILTCSNRLNRFWQYRHGSVLGFCPLASAPVSAVAGPSIDGMGIILDIYSPIRRHQA
jgi:hypothetical protein